MFVNSVAFFPSAVLWFLSLQILAHLLHRHMLEQKMDRARVYYAFLTGNGERRKQIRTENGLEHMDRFIRLRVHVTLSWKFRRFLFDNHRRFRFRYYRWHGVLRRLHIVPDGNRGIVNTRSAGNVRIEHRTQAADRIVMSSIGFV